MIIDLYFFFFVNELILFCFLNKTVHYKVITCKYGPSFLSII